jgi:hypothetical protein
MVGREEFEISSNLPRKVYVNNVIFHKYEIQTHRHIKTAVNPVVTVVVIILHLIKTFQKIILVYFEI